MPTSKRFSFMPAKRQRFIYASRKVRKARVMKLKKEIAHQAAFTGGLFASYDSKEINDPNRPEAFKQQFVFKMLGKNKLDIYEVYVFGVADIFWNEVAAIACRQVDDVLDKAGVGIKEPVSINGKYNRKRTREVLTRRCEYFECLGGRTRSQEVQRISEQMIIDNPPDVFESTRIDFGARHAILINVVIDVPYINLSTIQKLAERLKSTGPVAFKSAQVVDRSHLPTLTLSKTVSAWRDKNPHLGF